MAGFAAAVTPDKFDDFVMHTREKSGRDLTNVVTPDHPTFRMLEKHKGIEDDEPGRGPVEDIRTETANRTTILSLSNGLADRNLVEHSGITRATYDWIMAVTDFVINYYDYLNATGAVAMMKIVEQKLEGLDIALEETMVDMLWNGKVSGTEKLFGLKDLIRFTATADPAKGKIGGIGVADVPTWTNQSKNYNTAFMTVTSGALVNTFLTNGTNSWLALYRACSNNPDNQVTQRGCPNLIACNEVMDGYLHALHEQRRIFVDEQSNVELGIDGFRYKNAIAYWDPNVPDDPNSATYGVAFFLNTWAFKWKYARGLKKQWSNLVKMSSKTGYQADETTQVALTVKDLRRLGVSYGVKPAVVS